jgi:hypothetical protein
MFVRVSFNHFVVLVLVATFSLLQLWNICFFGARPNSWLQSSCLEQNFTTCNKMQELLASCSAHLRKQVSYLHMLWKAFGLYLFTWVLAAAWWSRIVALVSSVVTGGIPIDFQKHLHLLYDVHLKLLTSDLRFPRRSAKYCEPSGPVNWLGCCCYHPQRAHDHVGLPM